MQNYEEFLRQIGAISACAICGKQMQSPVLTECQKRCCKQCVESMLALNQCMCQLCGKIHNATISATVDKQMEKILAIYNNAKGVIGQIEEKLNKYEDKSAQFYLDFHFSEIKRLIDIETEKALMLNQEKQENIIKLNKNRRENVEAIDNHMKGSIQQADNNEYIKRLDELKNKINELDGLGKEWCQKLAILQLDEIATEFRDFKVGFGAALETFEKWLFNNTFYIFIQNGNYTNEPFVGELKIYNKYLSPLDYDVSK